MTELTQLMTKIGNYPLVHITQKNPPEFKITIGGQLMESFFKLGKIQEEIKNSIGEDYELKTIYGEGQDAILKFTKKEA